MQVRLAVAGTILCSFMQCAAAQGPPLVGTASAMPSSPVDAAIHGATNPDERRDKLGLPRSGGLGPGGIRIQGDGIGLPQGVGGNPAPRAEKDKEPEKKNSLTSSACVGPNRDSQSCAEKESDPVARRIDQGLERSPGAVRPTDIKVQESGVATPSCFGDSRDGVGCAK